MSEKNLSSAEIDANRAARHDAEIHLDSEAIPAVPTVDPSFAEAAAMQLAGDEARKKREAERAAETVKEAPIAPGVPVQKNVGPPIIYTPAYKAGKLTS
jgi:hypothetical protein